MGKQVWAAIRISIASIGTRAWPSLTTVLTIALVVVVLLGFEAMAYGFQSTLDGAGSTDVAVLLSNGARKELNSRIAPDQLALIPGAPGIAQAGGKPVISGELYVTVDGIKKGTSEPSTLMLRGMAAAGPSLRRNFRLEKGRMFTPGRSEVIVGQALQSSFRGMAIGDTLAYAGAAWRVVGVFSTKGSVAESEMWSDADTVRTLFRRPAGVQSVRVRLAKPGGLARLRDYLSGDQRLGLSAQTEAAYMKDAGGKRGSLIMKLGWPLAIAMALGAIAGAINTTYNSVAARATEIATLRAIGFGATAAFAGTLVESLVLALAGGALAILVAYFAFDGLTASTMGGGFTQQIFSFRVTSAEAVQGLVFALVIGLAGGLIPAIRAARMPILEGLHE